MPTVTLQAVRVYGSDSQVGATPRSVLPGSPLIFEGLPAKGERVVISLGPYPEQIFEANRVRRAIGLASVRARTGDVGSTLDGLDGLIENCLQDVSLEDTDGGQPRHNWYVALAMERRVEVDDSAILPEQHYWLDEKTASQVEEDFLKESSPVLDHMTTSLLLMVGWPFFQEKILDDRVFFAFADRHTYGLPKAVASLSLKITRAESSVNAGKMAEVVKTALSALPQTRSRLAPVLHLFLESFREVDPLKQFLWSFQIVGDANPAVIGTLLRGGNHRVGFGLK